MAETREIKADIQQTIGSFPNLGKVAGYLGWDRDKTKAYLKDVPCYRDGKEIKVLAIDLAKKINRTRFSMGDGK